jgi:hypothetical protein
MVPVGLWSEGFRGAEGSSMAAIVLAVASPVLPSPTFLVFSVPFAMVTMTLGRMMASTHIVSSFMSSRKNDWGSTLHVAGHALAVRPFTLSQVKGR